MGGEQVIYHDVPSPRPPPPPQIPSGAPAEVVQDEPPKKKCGFLTKFIIVTLVVCLIVFLAVGFSPVGRFSAGNKGEPDSATEGVTDTYEPTFFPTSWPPSYVPTYAPTPGEEEEEDLVTTTTTTTTTTVAATEAAAVTTVAAEEGDEDGNVTTATEEAPLDLSWMGNSTTNITDANVTSTTNATEAVVATTTTTTPALICNLQIKYEIKSPNATYALTSKSDNTTTIFPTEPNEFDGVDEWLYIDQEFEVELCVEAGEYELTMSEGVCIGGTLRDTLIFYQCAAGSIAVNIE